MENYSEIIPSALPVDEKSNMVNNNNSDNDLDNETYTWEESFYRGLYRLHAGRNWLVEDTMVRMRKELAANALKIETLEGEIRELVADKKALCERVDSVTLRCGEYAEQVSTLTERLERAIESDDRSSTMSDMSVGTDDFQRQLNTEGTQTDECKDNDVMFEGLMRIKLTRNGSVHCLNGMGQDHGPAIVITPRQKREVMIDTIETILDPSEVTEVNVDDTDDVISVKLEDHDASENLITAIHGMIFDGDNEKIVARKEINMSHLRFKKNIGDVNDKITALFEDTRMIQEWKMLPSLTDVEHRTISEATTRTIMGWDLFEPSEVDRDVRREQIALLREVGSKKVQVTPSLGANVPLREDEFINHFLKCYATPSKTYSVLPVQPSDITQPCFYQCVQALMPDLFPTVNDAYEGVKAILKDIHGNENGSLILEMDGGGFPFASIECFLSSYSLRAYVVLSIDGNESSILLGKGEREFNFKYIMYTVEGRITGYHYEPIAISGRILYALPSKCGTCDSYTFSKGISAITCYKQNCLSDTTGIMYSENDENEGCRICAEWVPRTSDRAQNPIHYGDFPPGPAEVESLRSAGTLFFVNRMASDRHLCNTPCIGSWSKKGDTILVPRRAETDFQTFLNLFSNPSTDDQRLPSLKSVSSDVSEDEVLLDDLIDPVEMTNEELLQHIINTPAIHLPSEVDKKQIPQGAYSGGDFFDVQPHPGKSVFGLHKKQSSGNVRLSLIEILDNAVMAPWSVLNLRSGYTPQTISFRCDVEDDTDLFVNHLGLFMAVKSMEAALTDEIVLTRGDLEDIYMSQEYLDIFLVWTKYAYSISMLSHSRLRTVFSGPYSDPVWSIGRVFGEVDQIFSPKALKTKLISRDPILASITSVTLTVPLFGIHTGQNYQDVDVELLEILKSANIDTRHTNITRRETKGLQVATITGKNGKLNHYVKVAHTVIGTSSSKNYSSLGQIIIPTSAKDTRARVCGLFAFISSGFISSAPHKIEASTVDDMLNNCSANDLKHFLDHLSYVKKHMSGPPINYTTMSKSVRVNEQNVVTLRDYNSKSLSMEFELCQDAIFHATNRNCCPNCKKHFCCTVTCGRH
jgi:hypothetical protein